MKLMMVCPTCNGEGSVPIEHRIATRRVCAECKGTRMIAPPQQILDDLECAEVERELIKRSRFSYVKQRNGIIKLVVAKGSQCKSFKFKTWELRVEALRQAKDWMDGRGAE